MSIDCWHEGAFAIAASMASRLCSVTGHSFGVLGFGAASAMEASSTSAEIANDKRRNIRLCELFNSRGALYRLVLARLHSRKSWRPSGTISKKKDTWLKFGSCINKPWKSSAESAGRIGLL